MSLTNQDVFWLSFSAVAGAAVATAIVFTLVVFGIYVHELWQRYRQSEQYPDEAPTRAARVRWAFKMAWWW